MAAEAAPRPKDPVAVARGKASQSAETWAVNIGRHWDELTPYRQNLIKAALVPLLCPEHSERGASI